MDDETSQHQEIEQRVHDEDETLSVTAMVSRIDLLEQTMHIMEQMREFTAVRANEKGKTTVETLQEDVPMIELREPDTSAQMPALGRTRWQIKDLKPPKYNGNTTARTTDAVEQWLSK